VRIMDTHKFRGHAGFWEACRGCTEENRVRSDRFAAPLQEHLARVKAIYEEDLNQGKADVYIWPALERKYPNARKEWIWQYVFPAKSLSGGGR